MLALWIILGILALIVLLLALPLRIFLKYTPESGLQYRIKYCFLTLTDSEKIEKPPEKDKKRVLNRKNQKKEKKTSQNPVRAR